MWEVQALNRRKSIAMVAALGAIMILGFALVALSILPDWRGAAAGAVVGCAVWLGATLITVYFGSDVILKISRVRPAARASYKVLYNVTEEMCVASGLPMPRLYILDDTAPNAFTTGRNPETAVVVVTTGLVDKLNRHELQAVIAHEMSHVKNRDVLYMLVSGVMLGLIVMVADGIRNGLRRGAFSGGNRGGKNGGGAVVVVLILMALFSLLAPIVAKLLFFAISRKREFLADACAAEMTRYPDALADALEKISNDNEVLEAANRATCGMFIVNPIKRFEARAQSMFSTHPPMQERVLILRAMGRGGDASLLAYNNLYRQLSHSIRDRRLIPASELKRAQPLPVVKPLEDLKAPAKTREEQLQKLKSIQRLVLGAATLQNILCRCGHAFEKTQFEKLSAQNRHNAGVVECPSCHESVLGPGALQEELNRAAAAPAPSAPPAKNVMPGGTVIPIRRKNPDAGA